MEADRTVLLNVENLSVSYRQNHVLEGISFHVKRGEFVGVIDPTEHESVGSGLNAP